jgi:hypothetical protein
LWLRVEGLGDDNIYAKLGVGSRTEAVVRAISSKLVSVPDDHR